MTSSGARGETRDEMLRTLRLPQAKPYGGISQLLASMEHTEGYELFVANRLFGDRGTVFKDGFLRATRDLLGADFGTVDFRQTPEAARQEINQWVAQATRSNIQGALPPGTIRKETRLVLANAVYFKGRWAAAFAKQATREAVFHVDETHEVPVAMMSQRGTFGYRSVPAGSLLELPYRGDALAMVIFLPSSRGGLATLEAGLTSALLEDGLHALPQREVDIALPRFALDASLSLNDVLSRMGIRRAFESGRADFSGMSSEDLYLDRALHQAHLAVDEEGTVAAASTEFEVSLGFAPKPVAFRADHPFAFLIRDGRILFVGRMANPVR
jgi:serpin B